MALCPGAVASAALTSAGSATVVMVLLPLGCDEADAEPGIKTQPAAAASAPPMTVRRDGACASADLATRARHSAAARLTMAPDRRHPMTRARRRRIAQPRSS